MSFNNRVAVITGAGGGIGRALCKKLHAEGVALAATDHTPELAERAMEELNDGGARMRGFVMDVANADSVRTAGAAILAEFGKIDILVNNAGIGGIRTE